MSRFSIYCLKLSHDFPTGSMWKKKVHSTVLKVHSVCSHFYFQTKNGLLQKSLTYGVDHNLALANLLFTHFHSEWTQLCMREFNFGIQNIWYIFINGILLLIWKITAMDVYEALHPGVKKLNYISKFYPTLILPIVTSQLFSWDFGRSTQTESCKKPSFFENLRLW